MEAAGDELQSLAERCLRELHSQGFCVIPGFLDTDLEELRLVGASWPRAVAHGGGDGTCAPKLRFLIVPALTVFPAGGRHALRSGRGGAAAGARLGWQRRRSQRRALGRSGHGILHLRNHPWPPLHSPTAQRLRRLPRGPQQLAAAAGRLAAALPVPPDAACAGAPGAASSALQRPGTLLLCCLLSRCPAVLLCCCCCAQPQLAGGPQNAGARLSLFAPVARQCCAAARPPPSPSRCACTGTVKFYLRSFHVVATEQSPHLFLLPPARLQYILKPPASELSAFKWHRDSDWCRSGGAGYRPYLSGERRPWAS